jgi:hypothetical protein
MPQATMATNLFQTFQIFTDLGVYSVGENLGILSIDDVLLSVQEPRRDFELCRILYDGDNALKFVRIEFSSAIRSINEPAPTACFRPGPHRLLRSTSAFLHTKFEYRRPTPLISVKAYITLRLPSTLVLSRRKMC